MLIVNCDSVLLSCSHRVGYTITYDPHPVILLRNIPYITESIPPAENVGEPNIGISEE